MSSLRIFVFFAAALSALGLLTSPAPARACKCMVPTPALSREQASAVFEGRVTNISSEGAENGATNVVTFALVRTWKGLESDEVVTVRTSGSTASCGIAFERNKSYLVYASTDDRGLQAGSCGGT